jgi:hypothetical protein
MTSEKTQAWWELGPAVITFLLLAYPIWNLTEEEGKGSFYINGAEQMEERKRTTGSYRAH